MDREKGKGARIMRKKTILSKENSVFRGYHRRTRKYILVTGSLFLLLLCLASFTMVYGNTIYSPNTVIRVLLGEEIDGAVFTIRTLRFPRMLAGILAGIAFGTAGNTFQKLLGNPLASPDIIGVTSGASVAAVFAILILQLKGSAVSVLAVLAGIAVAALIYALAQGSGFSNGRLILTGIGTQAFLNAIISWMLLKASEYDVANALRWLSGSLNGVTMEQIPRLLAAVAVGGIFVGLLNKRLTVMQLGEAFSTTLGARPNRTRLFLILTSILLTAFATSVTGPIASVAFLSGPIASRLTGGGRGNMAASALTGAVLVLASDLIGQYALPTRYPVGVVTGILGAPYLLFLLLRTNHKGESV